jgi:hypothetical protein
MPESERMSVEEHGASAAPSNNVIDISTPSPISRSCKLSYRNGPRKKRKTNAFDALMTRREDCIPVQGGRGAGSSLSVRHQSKDSNQQEAPAVWYHDHWVPANEAEAFAGSLRSQAAKRRALHKANELMKCRYVTYLPAYYIVYTEH